MIPEEGRPASLAEAPLGMIDDGFTVGLGTGRAATAFVEALARRGRRRRRRDSCGAASRSLDRVA
jgi:ribose 5-phosphate isomerase